MSNINFYPLKTRFHASGENNNHGRFTSSDTHQSFPYDQSRRHNHPYHNNNIYYKTSNQNESYETPLTSSVLITKRVL